MERFFGFDLGDAESAVARLCKTGQDVPEMLKICSSKSFITAYAVHLNGKLLIGEQACYSAQAIKRGLRFKSHFLDDAAVESDVKRFASGVLGELYTNGDLIQGEDCCFYIGCPAGWNKNARESYRRIFQEIGYPPVRIISESRAALISACQSKHLQVGYDILSKPVLVIDIGSSTTDFAYICGGKEVEMQTAGEVRLGGGIMDEILLSESVRTSKDRTVIENIFAKSDPWRSYCEFAARRLKEKYYSDPDYWKTNPCSETVLIRHSRPARLTLRMDEAMAQKLTREPVEKLHGKSFKEVFLQSLENVKENITGESPQLLFLTGGVSRLADIRSWCSQVFPEAVIISGAEPEFSVARGLAWSAKVDDELADFRAELKELTDSHKVEDIVAAHIKDLYRSLVDTLTAPIIEQVASPIFTRWRNGEIERISDVDGVMENDLAVWIHSQQASRLMSKCVTTWLRKVSDELEAYTMPICIRHHVPYAALNLNSYLSSSDIDIRLDSKNVFAVDKMAILIESIISLLAGFLCGGSGIALLYSGPAGILAGVIISLTVLSLGREKMEQAIYTMNIPKLARKLVPAEAFQTRTSLLTSKAKKNFYENLENERNEEIIARMTNEISEQIELCLTRMAEVVEIPLG